MRLSLRLPVAGLAGVAALALTALPSGLAAGASAPVGLNVVLNTDISPAIVSELSTLGTVDQQYPELDALTMQVDRSAVNQVAKLRYVVSAKPDVAVKGGPVSATPVPDLTGGRATWNLDQINVHDVATGDREATGQGAGVYVAVLDTGLLSSWPAYFPDERIAEEFAAAFGGGGGEKGSISTLPNKWASDQNGHGTHVTSTILGYDYGEDADGNDEYVGGVAPLATVIPVKVLNQNGAGWSSVIAAGIEHVVELKDSGRLGTSPVVINLSLGAPEQDLFLRTAIQHAISRGILVVASAGNEGSAGMGYPGAWPEVISVAANGWSGQYSARDWWYARDVAEKSVAADAYIPGFSSRAGAGQDLDLAAPGVGVVGPYQTNSKVSWYYMSGTSQAAPHVAGTLALMAAAAPGLTQTQAEKALEQTAVRLEAGSLEVVNPATNAPWVVSWGADATGAGVLDASAAVAAVSSGPAVKTRPRR